MTNDKELSDLKIERKECPKCGATWINGQHRWNTGAMGSELDLAGLVCNTLADQTCINPIRGIEGGDTWEDRFATIHKLDREKRDEFEAE
jgi:ribosomal protein S27AE